MSENSDFLYTINDLSEETGLSMGFIRRQLKSKGYKSVKKRGKEFLYNYEARRALEGHKPKPQKKHAPMDKVKNASCFAELKELRNRITDLEKTQAEMRLWQRDCLIYLEEIK